VTTDREVILWDFDGTLVWSYGLWRSALMQALDEQLASHGVTPDDLRPHLRDGFPWHHPERPHPELCDPEAWWAALEGLFVRILATVGVPEEARASLARRARLAAIDPSSYRLFDDALPALDELSGLGWRHVILSNHVPELEAIVTGLGIGDRFAEVITSARIGYEKPHPEAFRIALAKAGDPERVWMVGDSLQADVAGAEAVGIPAILLRHEGEARHRVVDCWGVLEIVE
jgi:putative hydrolase of the HAD superfamily